MINYTATQFARVAEQLVLTDADAVSVVGRWTEQRERTGRPIGSPAAVLATMTDGDIRTELARYIPRSPRPGPKRCSSCVDTNGLILHPETRKPVARCQHDSADVG